MKTICICGGGNLGHVVATMLAAQGEYTVNIFTNRPQLWSHRLCVELPDGSQSKGDISTISSQADVAAGNADIVLLCLPGFLIKENIDKIVPHLKPSAVVGSIVSSTGFFFEAMKNIPEGHALFGFQRVPYIARTIEYGHKSALLGFKPSLNVSIERCSDSNNLREELEKMFTTPVRLLNNYYEASLTNSNPLLHPARLYGLWNKWSKGTVYDRIPYFYEEWDEFSAELYINMDNEFQQLLRKLPVEEGCIPSVLDYYESKDAASLARKLRSIEAFKGILSPMKAEENGFVPDFKSRYFTEDFPYGLRFIKELAEEKKINTPYINKVYSWGSKFLSSEI